MLVIFYVIHYNQKTSSIYFSEAFDVKTANWPLPKNKTDEILQAKNTSFQDRLPQFEPVNLVILEIIHSTEICTELHSLNLFYFNLWKICQVFLLWALITRSQFQNSTLWYFETIFQTCSSSKKNGCAEDVKKLSWPVVDRPLREFF